jgi:hypothetical protein
MLQGLISRNQEPPHFASRATSTPTEFPTSFSQEPHCHKHGLFRLPRNLNVKRCQQAMLQCLISKNRDPLHFAAREASTPIEFPTSRSPEPHCQAHGLLRLPRNLDAKRCQQAMLQDLISKNRDPPHFASRATSTPTGISCNCHRSVSPARART